MARVTLIPGIAAIHGRIGNTVFRSRKQADGSYKVFAHEMRRTKPTVMSRKRKDNGSTTARKRKDNGTNQ